jgi:hypothetical protein
VGVRGLSVQTSTPPQPPHVVDKLVPLIHQHVGRPLHRDLHIGDRHGDEAAGRIVGGSAGAVRGA